MKKLFAALLVIVAVIAVIVYLNDRNRNIDLDKVFDEKPPEISGTANTDPPQGNSTTVQPPDVSDNTPEKDPQIPDENDTQKDENNNADKTDEPKDETSDANTDADAEDKNAEAASDEKDLEEEAFEHTDAEKKRIIGRYIDAEEFYYTMQYQQFDLDSYDVIVRENDDGYNTEYHRVLYYDVNSKAELKEHYLEYFTEDFVSRLDMSSYIEENGKLYCAEVRSASSGKNAKHTYVAESIDKDNAVIVRSLTNGSGKQRIKAVNIGGTWYFASVAIN